MLGVKHRAAGGAEQKAKETYKAIVEITGINSFDKYALSKIIDRITVFGGDSIEIKWKVDKLVQDVV